MGKQTAKWNGMDWVLLGIGLIPVIFALCLYSQLPDRMATHFGINGTANGWMDKQSFLWLFSALVLLLPIVLKVTRRIDPKRENYEKFHRAFQTARLVITCLLSAIYGVAIAYNLGLIVNVSFFTMLGLGVLFLVLGNVMTQIRFNYTMGIRTPWTLANEEVWRRTHRLGGPLMMAAGLVAVICAFLPTQIAEWIFVAALLLAAGIPVVYSFLCYQKLANGGK